LIRQNEPNFLIDHSISAHQKVTKRLTVYKIQAIIPDLNYLKVLRNFISCSKCTL